MTQEITSTDKFEAMLTVRRILGMREKGFEVTEEQVNTALEQLLVMVGADNEERILNCGEPEIVQWYEEIKTKLIGDVEKTTRIPYSNVVDIIHCQNPEVAKELFDYFREKGHSVAMSTVQINTGTQGDIVVKKLDIMKNEKV